MSQADWKEMGFGNYPVTEIGHCTLTMSDGIDIAMKVWLPCKQDDIKEHFPYFAKEENLKWTKEIYQGNGKGDDMIEIFPTIMEYIPYAKDSSMTVSRDHARHPLFCSHGFVDFRVDIRGTGASSGFYFDEYDGQELEDGVEIIEWIALQSWSNKAVGLYGKSWGGFNGLQIAYKQPEALKAVISLYSTDNRFFDDMHYQGNTLIGNGLVAWSAAVFSLNARPPHPRYFPTVNDWKEFWLKRLRTAGQSFLSTWLHHQHKLDPYWKHGSICTDYKKVECPILVIGGHADAYKNAAFRMAATLNKSSKTIIGPWSHQWPDKSLPGPTIDFSHVCLEWWKYHLKGDSHSADVLSWPRFQLYVRNSFKPTELTTDVHGTWISLPEWQGMLDKFRSLSYDNQENGDYNLKYIYFGSNNKLLFKRPENNVKPVELYPHGLQGVGSGAWYCNDIGFPEDQTITNQHSHCWITDVLERDIIFTGFAKVFVCVEASKTGRYCLQVRLCDQIPSGESTFITRGCQNLCLSEDGWRTVDFPAKQKRIVCVELNGMGQRVNSGHQILISITPTYFPSLFPAIDSEGLMIYPSKTKMVYQTIVNNQLKNMAHFGRPKPFLKLAEENIKEAHYSVNTSYKNGKYNTEIIENEGLKVFPSMKYRTENERVEKYVTDDKVSFGDVFVSTSNGTSFDLGEKGIIKTVVETNQEMTGNKQHFHIKEELKVHINSEEAFSKIWDNVVPRKFV